MKRVDDIFDINDIYEEEEATTDIDQSSSESEGVTNNSDTQQESDEDTSDSSDGDESVSRDSPGNWPPEIKQKKRVEWIVNQPHRDEQRKLKNKGVLDLSN